MIHQAIRSHADLMLNDQRAREDAARERAEAAAAEAEKPEVEEEDEKMPAGPSPEYQAITAMVSEMQSVVKMLANTTSELQKTQADMVPILKRAAAPKRAVRDEAGKIVGSEPVE